MPSYREERWHVAKFGVKERLHRERQEQWPGAGGGVRGEVAGRMPEGPPEGL